MRSIDPHLLDDITGAKALEWATQWSRATEDALDSPDTAELRARLRDALDTNDRIPYVVRRGEYLYNFWRDARHPRGVWRRTSLDEYLSPTPRWEVLVNVDTLAQAEGEDWVWKGATVLPLTHDRALLKLSRGGADAVAVSYTHLTLPTKA